VAVNGKQKGSGFERDICKALSLWVSKGEKVDLYWRSAMSGGRATIAKGAVRQAGDITAVAPEGHILTDVLYMELKFLKDISLDGLLKGNGNLLAIWLKTCVEATKYQKTPVLIFKQNHYPVIFTTTDLGISYLKVPRKMVRIKSYTMNMVRFDELIKIPFVVSK
jgi:hypothetical protein